jgi:ABC transporter substrate binding protein
MRGLRIAFTITLLLGGLWSPSGAGAQQATKVARIGYLSVNLAAAPPNLHEAFRQGLRDPGYVEGRNVVIEYRDAEGRPEQLPRLAAELVALKVDVIMAGSTPNARAAKQATTTIPIVFLSGWRSGKGRAREQPCAAGWQSHGVVLSHPGASRQVSGAAHAGRSRGQSGRGPLAARRPRRTDGE